METLMALDSQLPDFYCIKCHNYLNIPVMLCEEGNVCGRCFNREVVPSNMIRNKALENVIKFIEAPCRYKNEGCPVKLIQTDIASHEEFCSYRHYNCPIIDQCMWRGSVANLTKHFEGCHPTLLLKSNSLEFEFDIDLSISDYGSHILLLSNSESFLLQIKIAVDNLWVAVCYIGDDEKGMKYEYFIEEIGYKRSFYFRHDSRKAILSQNYMPALDKDRAISIELAPLKIYFTNAETITAKLKILGGDPVEEFDENLLSHLECPVCNMYMLPPIHQCLTGHNICSKCRPKIGQCPTCRGRIENTRNYALESVSTRAKYPCVNRIYGCMVVLPGSLIEKHEQDCQLRLYQCITQNSTCAWQGRHSDLLEHLRQAHKVKDFYKTKINYNGNQFYMYTTTFELIIAYDQIFRIGHKYENNSQTVFWNCRVIGTQNKNKYKFRITYSNDSGDFLLSNTSPCLQYAADDEFFANNMSFPQTLTTRVGNTVKCEIIKL